MEQVNAFFKNHGQKVTTEIKVQTLRTTAKCELNKNCQMSNSKGSHIGAKMPLVNNNFIK